MAQLFIGAAAAAILGPAGFGLTTVGTGFAIGAAVGSLFAPQQKQRASGLGDLRVAGTEYGQPIPVLEGHGRTAGQLVWASIRRRIKHRSSAGKGMGGGSATTETYEVDLLILLANNQCQALSRVWNEGKLVYNVLADADPAWALASANTDLWSRITLYSGAADQLPDAVYEAAVGSAYAPAYRGRTSMFLESLQLDGSGRLPNLTVEIGRTAVFSDYATLALYAPLTSDKEDTVSPAATAAATTSGTTGGGPVVAFGSTGLAVSNTYASNFYQVTYSGTKLFFTDSAFDGLPVTISVDAEVTSLVITDGYTSGIYNPFLKYVTAAQQFHFGFRVVSGAIHLYSSHISGGTTVVDHGAPTSSSYKLVCNIARDTIDFYNGATLLRSVAYDSAYGGSIQIRSNYSDTFAGQGPVAWRFQDLRMYGGDEPVNTMLVSLQDETLQDVVTRLMLRAGYESGDFDASGLAAITKPVHSMWSTQVSAARGDLENLAEVYYFGMSCWDKPRFYPLGGAAVVTIPYEDLQLTEGGNPEEAFELRTIDDIERPAQVAVSFQNVDGDYNTDTAYSQRLLLGQASTSTLTAPLGLTPAEAKGVADTKIARIASETLKSTITVGPKYSSVVPGSVIVVTARDGSLFRMRVDKRSQAGLLLTFDLTIDDASVYVDEGVGASAYVSSSVVNTPADTQLVLLDLPILRDADNDVGLYAAAKGLSSPWPGASLIKGLDGVTYDDVAVFEDQAVIGTCLGTLGDWTAGNRFDETSTVTVSLGLGTLTSSTRSALLDAEANACAIGVDGRWEVLQFRNAALLSAGVYTLSGLLRGRRGTEWASVGHVAGESFVLLRLTGLRRATLSVSELYAERHYKAVTLGRRFSTADDVPFTCRGVAVKPRAPINLRADRITGGDVVITFNRRTRLAYSPFSMVPPPLGEATEAYAMDVYADGTFTTIVRADVRTTTEQFTYTAAQQTADFGSLQAVVYVHIHQLSAVVGRGYELEGAA